MYRWLLIIVAAIPLTFYSCEKTNTNFEPQLSFYPDTVFFDTVFTAIGSVTKEIHVRNNSNCRIIIDKIYLAGGEDSPFRINIDGESETITRNTVIYPRDTLFIFVDVIINPLNEIMPVSVTDSIIFETGDKTFRVILQAWGQDVIMVQNKINGNEVWDSPKPYLVYGNAIIDTLCKLIITEGVRVLFHKNSSLIVEGNIIVSGSVSRPVLFATDIISSEYNDVPGLWNGIYLHSGSTGNIINNAEIRNSTFGIQMGEPDKTSPHSCPDLQLNNVRILHNTVNCLAVFQGNLTAVNSVFAHCGKNCININSDGEYNFIHCTIINFWDYGVRLAPAFNVVQAPYGHCGTEATTVRAINSVIYGDMESEIFIYNNTSGMPVDLLFDHCLLIANESEATFQQSEKFPGSMFNKNPEFINIAEYDFRPDTLSCLINTGNVSTAANFPLDIRGASRLADSLPDIGAYERINGETKN